MGSFDHPLLNMIISVFLSRHYTFCIKQIKKKVVDKTDPNLMENFFRMLVFFRKGSNVNLTQLLADYSLDSQANSDCIHENLVMGMMQDNNRNTELVRNTVKSIKAQGSQFLLSVPPQVSSEIKNSHYSFH